MNVHDLAGVLRVELSGARVVNEAELQAWIERVLRARAIPHDRERTLEGVGRPDFMVGRTCIEVKVKGSRQDLLRQALRYTTSPDVGAVLVVTTRLSHTLPATLGDKPVVVVCVTAFGVL